MKIYFNPGFNNVLSKLLVFRNGSKISYGTTRSGCCEFDAKEGDIISIKFRYFDKTTSTITNFTFHEGKDSFYVYPSKFLKIWELFCYKAFLCICLLFIIYKSAMIYSVVYNRFFSIAITIMALSLVCLQFCMLNSSMVKKLYCLDCLQ